MVTPLSESKMHKWEARQEWDKSRRFDFWHLNRPTQQAIVDILVQAEKIVHATKNNNEALNHMSRAVWLEEHTDQPYHLITDGNGVDWSEVNEHIFRGGCVYDTDMEGYQLDSNKLSGEITLFQNIIDMDTPPLEDYF